MTGRERADSNVYGVSNVTEHSFFSGLKPERLRFIDTRQRTIDHARRNPWIRAIVLPIAVVAVWCLGFCLAYTGDLLDLPFPSLASIVHFAGVVP
jgi:hypothetical protein